MEKVWIFWTGRDYLMLYGIYKYLVPNPLLIEFVEDSNLKKEGICGKNALNLTNLTLNLVR